MKKLFYLIVLAVIVTACMNAGSKNNDAAKKEKMQRFYDEVMNAHNPAAVDSFVTADFIDHQADPHYPKGVEGLRSFFKDYFAAYPDIHMKTNFILVNGDTVIAHITMTGTNTGSFMGMPATNKPVNIDGVDIIVIKDGKAVEHWGYQEEGKMMMQLGMMGDMSKQNAQMADPSKMEEKK